MPGAGPASPAGAISGRFSSSGTSLGCLRSRMLIFQLVRYALLRFSNYRWVFSTASPTEPLKIASKTAEVLPSVSIVVPTRDKVHLLRNCIESIRGTTEYSNYEIVIIDNDSAEPETLEYLNLVESQGLTVLKFPGKFNFSKICNHAASRVNSDFLCFLNNDAEVVAPLWLGGLVSSAVAEDVCVSGPIILKNSRTTQEIGLAFGVEGIAGRIYSGISIHDDIARNELRFDHFVSAVSFACALVSRDKYLRLGGMDENLAVGLNDVDFCYRAMQNGFKNKIVSSALIIHKGYGTRPTMRTIQGSFKAAREVVLFLRKHKEFKFKDQYVNQP